MASEIEVRVTGTGRLVLSPAAAEAVAAGRADSTWRAYRADREEYVAWCQAAGLAPLPATTEMLAEYTTHLTVTPRPRTGRPSAPSTIERALAAIATMHEEFGAPKPPMKAARAVLSGYRQRLALAKDPAARPSKATPAVPSAIRAMLAGLDRTKLIGKRDAALVLLGFATAARVSELVALDIADVTAADHGLDVTLYRRKIKQFTDNAVLYGTDPATCPVRALRSYAEALAEKKRTEGPLFVRVDRHDRLAPPLRRHGESIGDPKGRMTADAAGDVVARLADRAGLAGDWSGHSLRRGFATAARKAGHDLVRIGRTGGWADGSRALLGYMEDADRVTDSPLVNIGL